MYKATIGQQLRRKKGETKSAHQKSENEVIPNAAKIYCTDSHTATHKT